jgi:ammonia channel protein AmtB
MAWGVVLRGDTPYCCAAGFRRIDREGERMSAALAALSTVGALATAVLLSLLAASLAGKRQNWTAVGLQGGIAILVTAAAWLTGVTGIPVVFLAPVIALGGLFGVVVTLAHRERSFGEIAGAIFAGILTAIVYVPLVSIVFTLWYDPLATGIGLLDFGAALPTEVAAGSAALAVVLVARSEPRVVGVPVAWPRLVFPTIGLVIAWLAWLIGLELDQLTPLTVGNIVLMAFSGAVASALVERARFRTNTLAGTILGLLAGLAAATPAAGYLLPGLAVVTALVAGAVCALATGRASLTPSRRVATVLMLGGATSLLLLGFLAKDVSFIYTGQPELFFGQVFSIVIAGVGGFGLGTLVWLAIRRVGRPRRQAGRRSARDASRRSPVA